jgi:hypothetical protein
MAYNLDIHQYSLHDLFHLFEIPSTIEIRQEHIRLAKQKVIMSHPDKSGLPPEYFIFYKKAFEMIVRYYESQNKISQNVPMVSSKDTEMIYEPISQNPNITKSNFSQNLQETKNFNQKFNDLFERNEMISKPDPKKNEWFQHLENPFEKYQIQSVKNTNQINEIVENIKTQEKERAMALYRGVVPLSLNSSGGKNLYDDIEEDENEYICSDPFSKLKYEDLRKVHKDQTVFMVSEKDMNHVKTYLSVDQFKRERENSTTNIKPMEKEKAEKWFLEEERRKQERILQKQHTSELKTMENMEKNKTIMASFLRIL